MVRHTLRHTAITHLVQAGIDLPTVKRISGHKTLAMVERYSHQNGQHIQAAMDKFGQRMRIILAILLARLHKAQSTYAKKFGKTLIESGGA